MQAGLSLVMYNTKTEWYNTKSRKDQNVQHKNKLSGTPQDLQQNVILRVINTFILIFECHIKQ